MKNIFLINKRNKINIKEQLNRANSDFAKSQTKFPKLKNTFFRINKVKIQIFRKNNTCNQKKKKLYIFL